MKVFLIFFLSASVFICKGQKKANIYLSHCDSLFYLDGDNFDSEKLKRGKMNDSTFINELFESIQPYTHKIFFKPYTDICIDGDGMADVILSWKKFFNKKGFECETVPTNSLEDKYFGEQSIYAYIEESKVERKTSQGYTIPRPPPPPPPALNELNTNALITFILTNNNNIYYYEGKFQKKYLLTNFKEVDKIITRFKNTKNKKNQFIAIKMSKNAPPSSVTDLIDKIKSNSIMPGHYAEYKISSTEQKYLDYIK